MALFNLYDTPEDAAAKAAVSQQQSTAVDNTGVLADQEVPMTQEERSASVADAETRAALDPTYQSLQGQDAVSQMLASPSSAPPAAAMSNQTLFPEIGKDIMAGQANLPGLGAIPQYVARGGIYPMGVHYAQDEARWKAGEMDKERQEAQQVARQKSAADFKVDVNQTKDILRNQTVVDMQLNEIEKLRAENPYITVNDPKVKSVLASGKAITEGLDKNFAAIEKIDALGDKTLMNPNVIPAAEKYMKSFNSYDPEKIYKAGKKFEDIYTEDEFTTAAAKGNFKQFFIKEANLGEGFENDKFNAESFVSEEKAIPQIMTLAAEKGYAEFVDPKRAKKLYESIKAKMTLAQDKLLKAKEKSGFSFGGMFGYDPETKTWDTSTKPIKTKIDGLNIKIGIPNQNIRSHITNQGQTYTPSTNAVKNKDGKNMRKSYSDQGTDTDFEEILYLDERTADGKLMRVPYLRASGNYKVGTATTRVTFQQPLDDDRSVISNNLAKGINPNEYMSAIDKFTAFLNSPEQIEKREREINIAKEESLGISMGEKELPTPSTTGGSTTSNDKPSGTLRNNNQSNSAGIISRAKGKGLEVTQNEQGNYIIDGEEVSEEALNKTLNLMDEIK